MIHTIKDLMDICKTLTEISESIKEVTKVPCSPEEEDSIYKLDEARKAINENVIPKIIYCIGSGYYRKYASK